MVKARCARLEGFSLHADVAVPAPHTRGRLEPLCRYLLRPPLALERLSETAPALDESNGSPKPCSIPQIQFRKADWLGVRRSQRDQRAINPGLEFCKVERAPLGPPATLREINSSMRRACCTWRTDLVYYYCETVRAAWTGRATILRDGRTRARRG